MYMKQKKRSQSKTSGTDVTVMHGLDKCVDPNIKPETQARRKTTDKRNNETCNSSPWN